MHSSIVETLKGQTAAYRCIANDSDDLAIVLVGQLRGHRHAQSRRYRVAGMAGYESIIFALAGIGETAEATHLAIGVEPVATAREYLVHIGLVAHIPHQAVVGRVKHIVQGHIDFDSSHARGKMARIGRQLVNQESAQLLAQRGQRVDGQTLKVGRAVD